MDLGVLCNIVEPEEGQITSNDRAFSEICVGKDAGSFNNRDVPSQHTVHLQPYLQ
jgi:hypothetical protein